MNVDEKELLQQDGVHSGYKTVANYRIYLEWGNGFQEVRFRIEEGAGGIFEFTQSHFIKTPLQGGAYRTSVRRDDTIEGALRKAMRTIMGDYNQAISKGETPTESWFVKNNNY
jgi:hypothetical protein